MSGPSQWDKFFGYFDTRTPFSEATLVGIDAVNEVVYACVYNPGPADVKVYRHTNIALFTPVCGVGPIIDMNISSSVCEVSKMKASGSSKELPEHLCSMFEKSCEHIYNEQKRNFEQFLIENQECFARPGEVGRTNMGVHKIKLTDEKHVREPPTRIPL